MRPREDFYTHCPQCETRLKLTLATKLQAGRAGSLCNCRKCNHEWVCIQEWIYREIAGMPSAARAPLPAIQMPLAQPLIPMIQPVETNVVPRPHLFGQPAAMPVAMPAASAAQPAAQSHSGVPQPHLHAWSWERAAAARTPTTSSQ